MASNNSRNPLPPRKNGTNKKSKEMKAKMIKQLNEMFGSTFEPDIIVSVLENCDCQLEASIDALISLSVNQNTPQSSKDEPVYDPWAHEEGSPAPVHSFLDADEFLNMNPDEVLQQQKEFLKFEQVKESSGKKFETESLCGLKVQYRPRGMENNNSDDDADVVIEEESSDYRIQTPEPEKVNVCQFLSASTQSALKNTFPKVNYINTPSPPRTPLRKPATSYPIQLPPAISRLESDIQKGYKVLILMRGLPGSGKSFLSKYIVMRTVPKSELSNHIFSTDDYFVAINKGVYIYNPTQLSDAHAYNQNRVLNAMRSGWSPIIVDNTNTQAWEMQHYANFGVEHGYIVETLEPNTPWSRDLRELERRNVHSIPKAKIRMMMERYESNISGDRLLRMFRLGYKPRNQPPQMRKLPPLPKTEANLEQKMKEVTIRENSGCKPKIANAAAQAQSTVPQNLVDNDALKSIAKEYANLDSDVNVMSSNIDIKQSNESWTAGSSYKEDNLLDMLKLGAIGSERKNSSTFTKDEENEKFSKLEEKQSEMDYGNLNEVLEEKEPAGEILQCWDFTLIKDGMHIHSKFIEETNINFTENSDVKKVFVNNGEVTYVKCCKVDEQVEPKVEPSTSSVSTKDENKSDANNVLALQILDLEESFVTELSKTPPTPVSEKTSSSHSSSLERVSDVDMSQFDVCNPENAQVLEQYQATRGLNSIFNFIKNSLLRNEKKENKMSSYENIDEASENLEDKLTDKLRKNKHVSNYSPVALTSVSLTTSPTDTLSELLNSSCQIDENKNLDLKIQTVIDFPPESGLKDDEINDEFHETLENTEVQLTVDENIVRELLDASSDFQLVEEHISTEKITKNNEEKVCNVDYEKEVTEQIKNLQVVSNNEEDENKVSKEPIDKVFGSKNTFPEKIQNAISDFNNINLINWSEPPFPSSTKLIQVQQNSEIIRTPGTPETCDKVTLTNPYDFNVAFIGGTDEYKVLKTNSRNINDPSHQTQISQGLEQQSGRLKLHKGTMTNNASIFFKDEVFDLEDRTDELVKRFSHLLPPACILDVYKNLCRSDFEWTVDYINNLQNDEPTIIAAIDHLEDGNQFDLGIQTEARFDDYVSPVGTSPRHQSSTRSKKDKFKATPDTLALKQELESKIEINKESYKPHTLRVKRWKNREFGEPKNEDLMNLEGLSSLRPTDLLNENTSAPSTPERKRLTRLDHPAVVEEASTADDESIDDEEDETMELTLGHDFVRVLENEFGNPYFETPDNLLPVIQIKKSMAQELYALWVESVQRQVWAMQERLDAMIAKDAEYARSLEKEEEEAAKGVNEPEVPNLKEIMDMEMALATCRNDFKQKFKKESFKDLAFRVTQQTLHELFPAYDHQMMYEIYEAHDRNFEETLKIIKENCEGKTTITMADVIKKRKNLIDELHKESSYQTSRHNHMESEEGYDEACGYDYGDDYNEDEILTHDDAVRAAHNYRKEAQRQLDLRNENNQKAADAYRRKIPEVAAYYSDVAKLHIKKMEMANSAAASAILAAQAHIIESDDKIDLHYLKVTEALQALDIFIDNQLDQLTMGSQKKVYIITGRGARSSNGQSKIKPAIAKKLNSRNIKFSEANPGMLKAYIRKR